jgi:hypothetical protein
VSFTNKNTRDWLEAVRNRQDVTGIPDGEYVGARTPQALSKQYIYLAKRKDYQEPLYSTYA